MKPLKPGDKVAAYSGVFRKVGVVVESLVVRNREMVRVNIGTESKPDLFFYHRKQLRLITKKEKPATRQPRRAWVNFYPESLCVYSTKLRADQAAGTDRTDCVEFVEVMKEGE